MLYDLNNRLNQTTQTIGDQMTVFDDLTTQVNRLTTEVTVAVTDIQNLTTELQTALNGANTVQVQNLVTQLGASADALAAVLPVANTPSSN